MSEYKQALKAYIQVSQNQIDTVKCNNDLLEEEIRYHKSLIDNKQNELHFSNEYIKTLEKCIESAEKSISEEST